jgi:C4-dicarboxylate-specific signal transduction histidine kinase
MKTAVAALATVVLMLNTGAHAQTTDAKEDLPELTKTTRVAPTDSTFVRAAKRAVAARVATSDRRVLQLTTTLTRGRVSQSSADPNVKIPSGGSVGGPPVYTPDTAAEKAAMAQAEQVKQRTKELEQERERMAAEADEPYGSDVEEDAVVARQTAAGRPPQN